LRAMPSRKPKILVVDDEASVLVTYRMILEQQGYEPTAVLSSVEALEAVDKIDFDLLMCDLSLEESHTGFEIFAVARQRRPNIPCVLLTGYASHEAVQEAEKSGIAVLFKPIDIEEFLSTIATLVRSGHGKQKASGE
jgi:two-component system, NtrC family, nitrogen regulation response regulator NtrX